jgi:ubiquinone/menaquinone biosynthesis C-methylase UbiE
MQLIITFAAMSTHERAHHDEANNVTYQRCQFAYEFAVPYITGKNVLDVGCGNAYGTALMAKSAASITGLDYDAGTVADNQKRYSAIGNLSFRQGTVPPLPFGDASFDVVTAFQFIEHIGARKEFLRECLRVLRPGGKLLVTTPNVKKSLARNPFHVHEYTFDEMRREVSDLTGAFELKGLNGNERVNAYYAENGKFVRMILKFDILGLHKRLPASWLTAPYNLVTNLMRNKLKEKVSTTTDITTKDFLLQGQDLDSTWDIYLIASK